jgi:hypothetical protein
VFTSGDAAPKKMDSSSAASGRPAKSVSPRMLHGTKSPERRFQPARLGGDQAMAEPFLGSMHKVLLYDGSAGVLFPDSQSSTAVTCLAQTLSANCGHSPERKINLVRRIWYWAWGHCCPRLTPTA